MIYCLEGLRGMAAIFVAIYHAWPNLLHSIPIIGSGWLWVDLFFVLSGFVISLNYADRLTNGYSGFADFAKRRIARLYPLHAITLFAYCFLAFLIHVGNHFMKGHSFESATRTYSSQFGITVYELILNIFLVHGMRIAPTPSLNFPSWSISVEVFTYVLFAILFALFAKKIFRLTSSVFLAVISWLGLFFLIGEPSFNYIEKVPVLRCTVGFFFGVLTYYCHVRFKSITSVSIKRLVLIVGVAASVSIFIWAQEFPIVTYFAPFGFSVLILGLTLEVSPLNSLIASRPLVLAGKWSYSIYLWHVPMLLFFKPIAGNISPDYTNYLLVPYLVGLLIIASLSFRYIEQPSNQFLLSKFGCKK